MYDKEFWMSAIGSIVAALVPLLVAYGLLSAEEADLWSSLILAVAAVVVPIVIGSVVKEFTASRAALKMTAIESNQPGLLERL